MMPPDTYPRGVNVFDWIIQQAQARRQRQRMGIVQDHPPSPELARKGLAEIAKRERALEVAKAQEWVAENPVSPFDRA